MDNAKPVVPRLAASQDIEAAVEYLAREASFEVAMRFIDALEAACLHVSTHPGSGSPRFGWDLGRPGLRVWPVKGFGYLAFYCEEENFVDLWRVLHSARDIPVSLRDDLAVSRCNAAVSWGGRQLNVFPRESRQSHLMIITRRVVALVTALPALSCL